MDQRQQNASIEILASFSLLGGRQLDYRETPISETSAAIASDPLRHDGRLPDTWIEAVDPRDDDGRETLRLLDRARARFASDGIETQTYVASDSGSEYLPEVDEDLHGWLGRLAAAVDINDSHKKSIFDVLRAYVAKFPARKFSELSESQQKTIATIVEKICAEAA
jgi:hypothetical protein